MTDEKINYIPDVMSEFDCKMTESTRTLENNTFIEYLCPKCGSRLQSICYTVYPPISAKKCGKCGWEVRSDPPQVEYRTWKEGDPI